jgi:hypothetical protein
MKYETPKLAALTPAINAIQGTSNKMTPNFTDSEKGYPEETSSAYADWE